MDEQKLKVIKLLENLQASFLNYSFGNSNKFTDFATLNQSLAEAIVDLKTNKYEGITFGIRVNKILGSINYALAFEGLRFSPMQKKAWHALYDPAQVGHHSDAIAMNLLGGRLG